MTDLKNINKKEINDSHNTQKEIFLVEELYSDDWDTRRIAVELLGNMGDHRFVNSLITAIKDEHWAVREAAAKALGKIGSKNAVEALILSLNDDELCVCKSAAEALGDIGDKKATDPLINILFNKPERIKTITMKNLKEANNYRVDPIMLAIKQLYPYVQKSAAEALGKIGDKKAEIPLLAALNNEHLLVRKAAKDALKKMGWNPGNDLNDAYYWNKINNANNKNENLAHLHLNKKIEPLSYIQKL